MSTVTASTPAKIEDKKTDAIAPLTFSNAAKDIVSAAATDETATAESALDWTQVNFTESDTFTSSDSVVEEHHIAFQLQHSIRPRNP